MRHAECENSEQAGTTLAPGSLWSLPGSKLVLVKRVRGEGTRMVGASDVQALPTGSPGETDGPTHEE